MQQRQALLQQYKGGGCTGSLPEHRFITPINLSIHIHDPLYNGPGIVLGIVPVDA